MVNRSIYRVAPCIIGKCEGKRLASLCIGRIMDIFNHFFNDNVRECIYNERECCGSMFRRMWEDAAACSSEPQIGYT